MLNDAAIKLEAISIETYVRDVLPQTFALWGEGRSYERYVEDFRRIAASAYGKRRRFTLGLRDGTKLACSCKNYDRELRWGPRSLRATGIGAVFTTPQLRGRGYASAMLGAVFDLERAAGRDLVFLYSNIGTAFYGALGFVPLPSRILTLRASSLDGRAVGATPFEATDWPGVRRCFENLDVSRTWSLRRTPLIWNWMRDQWAAPWRRGIQPVQLALKRGRNVAAYAIGRRIPAQDTFVLDDFSYDGEEPRRNLPALLRAAAGDLRRIAGWLPPAPAREALPHGSVRARKEAIFMVVPLSRAALSWWDAVKDATLSSRADPIWSSDRV